MSIEHIDTNKLAKVVARELQQQRKVVPKHVGQSREFFRQVCEPIFNGENIPWELRGELRAAIGQILGIASGIAKRRSKEKVNAILPVKNRISPQVSKPMFTRKQIQRMKGESLANINLRKDYLLSDP